MKNDRFMKGDWLNFEMERHCTIIEDADTRDNYAKGRPGMKTN